MKQDVEQQVMSRYLDRKYHEDFLNRELLKRIISKGGLERPEDYRSVFRIPGRYEIIPKEFAEEFAFAAGFRNILVHIYEELDLDMLRKLLAENLKDFDTFAFYTAEYVAKLGE
ncbi:type VII toxin-antitoxin system HepT family RNase toxin [Methanosarcina siciliae]|uniref:type VII toxin-antitoxin system HepT family RNase toxin n=1 Tax=Methanosarcina siciliae TaxID=38027 RepID=UPI0006973A1C|nr:HepT-like ribonuclease domain-containing protein [Methanosarcina siciliae]